MLLPTSVTLEDRPGTRNEKQLLQVWHYDLAQAGKCNNDLTEHLENTVAAAADMSRILARKSNNHSIA